ncbi:hypothetical protein V8G54_008977, partial [Vigna mungo]
ILFIIVILLAKNLYRNHPTTFKPQLPCSNTSKPSSDSKNTTLFCRGPLEPKENQELIREAILAPFLVVPNPCASLSTKEPIQRVRPTLVGPRRSPSLTQKTYSVSSRNLLQA